MGKAATERIPAMAHPITIHRDHNNQELVLNAGRIVWAERIVTGGRSYTMLILTDGMLDVCLTKRADESSSREA
jgi:hypothetical protein